MQSVCREREGVCFEIEEVCREIEIAFKGSGRECVFRERERERESVQRKISSCKNKEYKKAKSFIWMF